MFLSDGAGRSQAISASRVFVNFSVFNSQSNDFDRYGWQARKARNSDTNKRSPNNSKGKGISGHNAVVWLSGKRLFTNSGEIVAVSAPNAPPSDEAGSGPVKTSKKYPAAVFINPFCRLCFWVSSANYELPLQFVLSSRF
jgi:hypothetical protein